MGWHWHWRAFWLGVLGYGLSCAFSQDVWIIDSPITILEPRDVGHIIVVGDGSLCVRDVPEPGLRVSGHIWMLDRSRLSLESSVIQIQSQYHGQYQVVATDQASISIANCDYRVPSGVQHGITGAGDAEVTLQSTDFEFVQLSAANHARLDARDLNGRFEVILMDEADMFLQRIPRETGQGALWVWVEFDAGSQAVYSPPMPGWLSEWRFPPAEATGIHQTCLLRNCEVLLWPMLLEPGCDLTLKDISEENWVVVGNYLRESCEVQGLENGLTAEDLLVPVPNRRVQLDHASIDTWNLYPVGDARVRVQNCLLGEILAMERAVVKMEQCTIDGSGGFFGAVDQTWIDATDCQFTCDVQVSNEARMQLHACDVLPYPQDPTGEYTRFGAHDSAVLLLDHTSATSTPTLGGDGVIGVTWLSEVPASPPQAGESVSLAGTLAVYTQSTFAHSVSWRIRAVSQTAPSQAHKANPTLPGVVVAQGAGNVEAGFLGSWQGPAGRDCRLVLELQDPFGRTLTGYRDIPSGR